MAMITLTTNTTNSRVGLCDTCGLCAQRRDILPTAGDERAQVEARVRSVVTSVLLQPGEFASKEMVTLVGRDGKTIPHVRILGPLRTRTQVELARTDGIALGIRDLPMRRSGELQGAAPLTLVGPFGTLYLPEVAMRSNRHIHMSPADAARFGVKQNDVVQLRIGGPEGVTFHNVQIRIHETWKLVAHLDTDDANAAGIVCEVHGELLK